MATWFDESRLDDEAALAAGRRPAPRARRVRRPGAPRGGEAAEATAEAVARTLEQQPARAR